MGARCRRPWPGEMLHHRRSRVLVLLSEPMPCFGVSSTRYTGLLAREDALFTRHESSRSRAPSVPQVSLVFGEEER